MKMYLARPLYISLSLHSKSLNNVISNSHHDSKGIDREKESKRESFKFQINVHWHETQHVCF